MLTFTKLWKLLDERGMKKTDLLEIISAPTLAKLSKNENINSSIIEKICAFLQCQPSDIMAYINEENLKKDALYIDKKQREAVAELKEQGYTEEQLKTILQDAVNSYLSSVFAGENPLLDMLIDTLEQKKNDEK